MFEHNLIFKPYIPCANYGRNGVIHAHGLNISCWDGKNFQFQPIVSGNRVSSAARLAVPLDQIDAVIQALVAIKQEHTP